MAKQQQTEYRGKILTSLYKSKSGKTAKSAPLTGEYLGQFLDKVQQAGDGAVVRLDMTSDNYRKTQNERLASEGKKGSAADYFLKVYTKAEIEAERAELEAQKEDI